ncbi:Hypothetical predicted protein, partial [Scomber scombrus]
TMELSKSLSHHSEMDFIPGPRGRGRGTGLNSYVELSAAATGAQTPRPPSWRKANSQGPLAFVQMSEERTDLRN